MSATQTLIDALGAFCDEFSMHASCDDCPVFPALLADETCEKAFARLVKASRSEPWKCSEVVVSGRPYCSLCGSPLYGDVCPGCGAVVA